MITPAEKALQEARGRYGFLTRANVEALAADPDHRLDAVLVRCGGGRFSCPAQDAEHFIALITDNPRADYVRDVSIPVGGGSFDPLSDRRRRQADPRREYYPDLINDEIAHSDADPGL